VVDTDVAPATLLTDVVTTHIIWEDGYLLPPTVPGLGVELDREAARKNPYRLHEIQHVTRRDGSVTNW
jgi:L-alanine-DL-glutamate epimerase-like enolase superfamily enzyme